MKKTIAVILCMVMSISILAGCGKKETGSDDGRVTLTIGLPQNAMVEDYETNAYTLWLEEQTGYNLEFQLFAAYKGDWISQLSTRLASGEEMPDILWGMSMEKGLVNEYGEDGYFIDLSEYYNDREKSASWWKMFEAIYPDEELRERQYNRMVNADNGEIYSVPIIEKSEIDVMDYQVYINQAWLDKLGLSMPTDAESLYQVAKAFVEKDPNGNGLKDELGIIGGWNGQAGSDLKHWIVNMFQNANSENWWNVDASGNLYMPYITDEYRQSLIYMNKMFKEGIITESVFSMTFTDVKALVNPADNVNTVGIWVGHPTLVMQNGNMTNMEYVAMPVWGYATENDDVFDLNTYITEDCENPDAAWNLLMTMSTDEGAKRARYGEKGVDWVEADEGTTSFLEIPAEIKVLNESAFVAQGNECWKVLGSTIMKYSENEITQLSDDMDEWFKYKMKIMKDYYDNFQEAATARPNSTIGVLVHTEEELEETELERVNCANYINTSGANFVAGAAGADPSDDKQWNEYLKSLEDFGLETWRKAEQKVYDKQYK